MTPAERLRTPRRVWGENGRAEAAGAIRENTEVLVGMADGDFRNTMAAAKGELDRKHQLFQVLQSLSNGYEKLNQPIEQLAACLSSRQCARRLGCLRGDGLRTVDLERRRGTVPERRLHCRHLARQGAAPGSGAVGLRRRHGAVPGWSEKVCAALSEGRVDDVLREPRLHVGDKTADQCVEYVENNRAV